MDELPFRAITSNHLPLIRELQQMQSDGRLVTPRDLTKLDQNAWLDLINKQVDGQIIGFPAETPGKDNTEKAQNYAQMLVQAVEERFPTAAIANEIERNSKYKSTDLSRFLANNPDFEFSNSHIEEYFHQNEEIALAGVDDKAGLKEQLKSMQRVFKLTPRYGEIQTLLSEGVNSARDIARMDESSFVGKFEEPIGESRAREIYRRATEFPISEETFNLSIRKFLKFVGINCQRQIELAVLRAVQDGLVDGTEIFLAQMTLEIKGLNLNVTFDGEIGLQ